MAKTIKSDIAVSAVETPLSVNRKMVTYAYVYVDGFDAARIMKKHKKERMTGWKQYDSDSVVHNGQKSHLWTYATFWKREKPIKRIKMGDEE